MDFEVTKVGERGQIVIPQPFREEMHIHKGEKFMVIRKDNVLIFKRILAPSKKEIENMFKRASEHVKKHRITKKDVQKAIKKARSRK